MIDLLKYFLHQLRWFFLGPTFAERVEWHLERMREESNVALLVEESPE